MLLLIWLALNKFTTDFKRFCVDIQSSPSSVQEFMPFCETYMTAFKNDIEYSQLVLHTAAVLQTNKFMQVYNPTKAINQAKGVLRKWNFGV